MNQRFDTIIVALLILNVLVNFFVIFALITIKDKIATVPQLIQTGIENTFSQYELQATK